MKAITLIIVIALSGLFNTTKAADSSFVSQRALLFADSLVKSFNSSNWNNYLNISYPGVIKYYGGKHQFTEYIQRSREINYTAQYQHLEMVQLIQEKNEWQCVVSKSCKTIIDGKPAVIISYLVGQSKDEGETWKYVDVAANSVSNMAYIMPDVFENILVPGRRIIF